MQAMLDAHDRTGIPIPHWTPEVAQKLANLFDTTRQMQSRLNDVQLGRRKVYSLPDGDMGIELLPSDDRRFEMPPDGLNYNLDALTPRIVAVTPSAPGPHESSQFVPPGAAPGVGAAPAALLAALLPAVTPVLVIGAAAAGLYVVCMGVKDVLFGKQALETTVVISDNNRRIIENQEDTKKLETGKVTADQLIAMKGTTGKNEVDLQAARAAATKANEKNPAVDALTAVTWLVFAGGVTYVAVQGFKAYNESAADKRQSRSAKEKA